jgi:hypothetical protein
LRGSRQAAITLCRRRSRGGALLFALVYFREGLRPLSSCLLVFLIAANSLAAFRYRLDCLFIRSTSLIEEECASDRRTRPARHRPGTSRIFQSVLLSQSCLAGSPSRSLFCGVRLLYMWMRKGSAAQSLYFQHLFCAVIASTEATGRLRREHLFGLYLSAAEWRFKLPVILEGPSRIRRGAGKDLVSGLWLAPCSVKCRTQKVPQYGPYPCS